MCRRWKHRLFSWRRWRPGAHIESRAPPRSSQRSNARANRVATVSEPPHSKRPGRLKVSASILPQLRHMGRWDPIPPMWLEGRIYLEFLRLIRDPVFRGDDIRPGLNKPVLLIPGFLARDSALPTQYACLPRIASTPP